VLFRSALVAGDIPALSYQAPITTGTTAQYLRGDLSLAAFPTIPTITGSAVLKGSAGNAAAAAAADVVGLFTGCSGTQYLGADGACHTAAGGTGGPRPLSGPGVAAKCQSAVAGAGFSLPSAGAPTATCEPDGIQAYLAFTANTLQTAYDRFDLPVDWTGALKLVLTGYSASTTVPAINVYLSCISTGATAAPTFGAAQAVSLTPAASSGRTSVSATLLTDATNANKACAAGDAVTWKLAITAAAAADLRVLGVRFTE
jgi:hypothetical protein